MELRKQFVMCKYFAYNYPCKWMNRNNECRSVHDEDIRNAFNAFQERMKIGENLTKKELNQLLDPKEKLTEMQLRVKTHLYMKYPRPLTKKEREEIQEEKDR